jgi:endonuclease/exonuclease/phosphatase family metal-dependent hydrolase
MRVRIVTINTQNLEGDPRRQDLLNQELRHLDPDLIALQEVIADGERDQLGSLLAGTNLHATHQAQTMAYRPPFMDRYGGTAVATRWPHRVVETLDLRLLDASDVPWATMAVVVDVPGEGEMLLIAATGSWRLDAESARERQVIAISDLDSRQRRPLPTIIAGDLNAEPGSASIRYLTGLQSLAGRSVHYHDAWGVAGVGPGYTWTVDNPNAAAVIDAVVGQPHHRRRIDYVLIGSAHAHPQAHCRILDVNLAFNQPQDGIWASDHHGLAVDVEIGRNSE